MNTTRSLIGGNALLVILVGCGGNESAFNGQPQLSPTATETSFDVRADAENYIAIKTLADADCTLHDATDTARAEMRLGSGADGVASFSFRPARGSRTRLLVSCADGSGATSAQTLELRSRDDIGALQRPASARAQREPLIDPDSRTAEEIRAAGFPDRPDPVRDPRLYAIWRDLVSTAPIKVAPRGKLAAERVINGPLLKESYAWSGYQAIEPWVLIPPPYWGAIPVPYEAVAGTWTIPSVSGSQILSKYHMSTWVGLGDGDPDGGMWQGGSTTNLLPIWNPLSGFSQVSSSSLWLEVVYGGDPYPLGVPASTGDTIIAILWLGPSTGSCGWSNRAVTYDQTQKLGYFVWNQTQASWDMNCINVMQFQSMTNAVGLDPGITGGSAEWVVERPHVDGTTATHGQALLPNFGTLQMQSAWAIDASNTSSYYSSIATNWFILTENYQAPYGNTLVWPFEYSADTIQFDWLASQ